MLPEGVVPDARQVERVSPDGCLLSHPINLLLVPCTDICDAKRMPRLSRAADTINLAVHLQERLIYSKYQAEVYRPSYEGVTPHSHHALMSAQHAGVPNAMMRVLRQVMPAGHAGSTEGRPV